METKLIMLPNPIVVSDEEIKEGDFMYLKEYHPQGQIRKCHYITDEQLMIDAYEDIGWGFCRRNEVYKIIAGIESLPKLDLSLIAERIGWVDVEKLAIESIKKGWGQLFMRDDKDNPYGKFIGERPYPTKFWHDIDIWVEAYKAAQSLNEKKYSEEDLFNLLKVVHDKRLDSLSSKIVDNGKVIDFNFWNSYSKKQVYASKLIKEFIQSLSKPKEYLVEVEMEVNQCDGCISGHHIIDGIHKAPYPSGSMVCKKHLYDRPKITNNTIKVTKVL